MGGNLQIVCFLQAVEIERLTGALSQYLMRYWYDDIGRCKEVDKIPLDRQSYEIQIKEMTDMIKMMEMNEEAQSVIKF